MKKIIAAALTICLLIGICCTFAANASEEAIYTTEEAATEKKTEAGKDKQKASEVSSQPATHEETPEKESVPVPERDENTDAAEALTEEASQTGSEQKQTAESETAIDVGQADDAESAAEAEQSADEAEMPETVTEETGEQPEKDTEEIMPEAENEAEPEGTTNEVDNRTTLADGEYTPENFSFSGGTGKVKITCNKVTVSGGKSYADIAFSSEKYATMKASGHKYTASVRDGKACYSDIPVALNRGNRILATTYAMSTPKEIEYSITVTLTEPESTQGGESSQTEEPVDEEPSEETSAGEEPLEEEPEYDDGDYDFAVESDFKMFKVVSSSAKVVNGVVKVTIRTSSASYDRIFIGSMNDDGSYPDFIMGTQNDLGGYDFTFELPKSALGKTIDFVPGNAEKWYAKEQKHLMIPAAMTPSVTPEPSTEPTSEPGNEKLEDGEYTIEVESSAAMFKVIACSLTAKDGKYRAVVTLSGTGYDVLYVGKADAAATNPSGWIRYATDSEGRYTYTLPDVPLDTPVPIAAHSIKNDAWYDRELTFKYDTAVKSGSESEPTPEPTTVPTAEPTATPAPDLSGSTSHVDNSTRLADGTYTLDKFSCSGGTGRVRVSCETITVSGGKVTAKIVFHSNTFSYVKANGQKIYGSHGGSTTTFVVPVALNRNNKIIGMTTAMSQDHEITYTMYFYLKAAEETATDSEDAPTVTGLTYKAKAENKAAKIFSIYEYEGGLTAIEVKGVGAYLLAPENAELPAGIEDEVTVISVPVESAYAAEQTTRDAIAALGEAASAAARLTGYETEDETLTYAGTYELPDYAKLLSGGCDLAIMPAVFANSEITGVERINGANGEPLPEETVEALKNVSERLDMLGIPLFVDRSTDEESEEACMEWIKVYGAIFGCRDAADAWYENAVAALNVA